MSKLFLGIKLLLFTLLGFTSAFSQNIDSLWKVCAKVEADSATLDAYYLLAYELRYTDPDTTLSLANNGIELATSLNSSQRKANLQEIKGDTYWHLSRFHNSIESYSNARDSYREAGMRELEGFMVSNIGYVHMDLTQYSEALDLFQKALAIAEEVESISLKTITLTYLADVYKLLNQTDKALETYHQTIEFFRNNGNEKSVQICLNNIGTIHYQAKELTIANDFFEQSLIIGRKLDDQKNIASALFNLGSIALDRKKYNAAIDYFQQSQTINLAQNDKAQLTQNYINLGWSYLFQNQFEKAKPYLEKAEKVAVHTENIEAQSSIEKQWSSYFQKQGLFEKALKHELAHEELKDSIFGLETVKQLNELAAVYQNERKELEIENLEKDKALQTAQLSEKESKLKEGETRRARDQLFRIFLYVGIGMLVIIVLIVLRGYRNKSNANKVIFEQKLIVEEKNREITDSINYAKRIQTAILPPAKVVKEYLEESFILYKPKDIVAGDFYWLEHVDGKILFAAADCTGHGVPGAMVSVVCNNGLNRSVREHGLKDPGKILDQTRKIIIEEFEKSEEEVKDGMDIALCAFYSTGESWILEYAGANNPLWIIRDGVITETKADKQPIGKYSDSKPFTTHTIELHKNDSIYVFSDGYVDQFGGDKGKKFKPSNLRKLLLSIQDKPMEKQRLLLDQSFESWRGDLEQIDDVCIIGVRI